MLKVVRIKTFFILSVLFILQFAICKIAIGETASIGAAFLASGHKKFPCKQALRMVRAAPEVYHATMWQTFGYSNMSAGNRCWRKIIKVAESKPLVLEFYLSNEVCRRKGNCYPQELEHRSSVGRYNDELCQGKRRTVRQVKRRMNEVKKFCDRFGSETTACLLAIGLESQFNECAARKLVSLAKEVGWDEKQLVHNPVHMSPYKGDAGAYYIESHNRSLHYPSGTPQRRKIATLDGVDPDYCRDANGREGISDRISRSDLQRWTDTNKTRVAYLGYWCSVHQGIEGNTSTSPDPRKRVPFVHPSDVTAFIEQAGYPDVSEPPAAPDYNLKRCTKVMSAKDGPGGFLWKESDHGGLVILLPGTYKVEAKRAIVVAPNGKRDKLKFTGWANPDHNGERQHYRHDRTSGSFSNKSVVKMIFRKGLFAKKETHCWKVEYAGERND